jgi:hypothetical protein
MIDKLRFQATPIDAPGIAFEIRPDREPFLELKIRTAEYPAGIVYGVSARDDAFRSVLKGAALELSGRGGSSVKLVLVEDIVNVTFTVPQIRSVGSLDLTEDDYRALIEYAVSIRTGSRNVYV